MFDRRTFHEPDPAALAEEFAWWCTGGSHGFRTERLDVRLIELGGLGDLFERIDPEISRWQGWDGVDRDEVEASYVARMSGPPRSAGVLVMRDRSSGAVTGCRSYFMAHDTASTCETGVWLVAEGRGKGLGSEELQAFVPFAHFHLGFGVVRSLTNVDNVAARRQIEQPGLTQLETVDGEPIEVTLLNGDVVHAAMYEHGTSFATCRCVPLDAATPSGGSVR